MIRVLGSNRESSMLRLHLEGTRTPLPYPAPDKPMPAWKDLLYESYVSSGQAGENNAQPAARHFSPRRKFLTGLISRHFPRQRDAKILDLGCGHGALIYFLRTLGYTNVTGYDVSAEQVALAQRLGIPGIQCGQALDVLTRHEAASLDVVCLFDMIEHLTRDEMFDLLREVRRVLAPNGRCIGHVPNAQGIFAMSIRYGDLTHEQAFTANSLAQMFRALSFSSVECFEDKPSLKGSVSFARRLLWEIGTAPLRILYAAETGNRRCILSQNLLFVASA